MKHFALFPSAWLLAVVFCAGPVHGQEFTCTRDASSPAATIGDAHSSGPLEISLASGSASWPRNFWIKDALGRALGDVEVEFVLPDSPSSLVFLEQNAPSATPKRAVVRMRLDCTGTMPSLFASQGSGTAMASARVLSGPSSSVTVPVRIVEGQSPVLRDTGAPVPILVALERPVQEGMDPAVMVEWGDGRGWGPLAGVPITFTAPATGPSVRFPNGDPVITVTTDAFGIARAPAVPTGAPGAFEVQATYQDGRVAGIWRYVTIRSPVIQLAGGPLEYGTPRLEGIVSFHDFPCDMAATMWQSVWSAVRVTAAGMLLESPTDFRPSQCVNGLFEGTISASLAGLPFGAHEVVAELHGNAAIADIRSAPSSVVIVPTATIASQGTSLSIGVADPGYAAHAGRCRLTSAQPVTLAPAEVEVAGASRVDVQAALSLDIGNCEWYSTFDGVRPPPGPPSQRVLVEAADELPPGTVAMAYGPTAHDSTPHWHELRTTVLGRFALFELTDAGAGDDSLVSDRAIRARIALGVPHYSATPGSFQDLWWVGLAENGWGLSLTQHRDLLFAALFIYDARGTPRWLVMSSGEWNAARTTYTGALYRPRGAPYGQNNAASFQPGAPVGQLRLTFTSRDTLMLDYTVDGVSGAKQLQRQRFGPPHPFPVPRFDDLWWGGIAENGWGFALAQQHSTFFGVIFTYDANGETTWFVAPAGTRTYSSIVESPLYRTRGAPWLGAAYDPARLEVMPVGQLRFSLFDRWDEGFIQATIDGRPALISPVSRQPF